MKNCHVAQKRIFIHNSSSVSISPSNTLVASPVIKTCLVAISHSMVSVPPSMPMIDFLPARPVRKAATAVAQAPVPQARVTPEPRSPYAHPYLSLFQYLGKLHIGAVGEERVILQFGADRGEVYLRNVVHEDYQMRVSHGYGSTRIAYAVYFDGMFCHRLAPLAVIVHGFVRRNTHVNGYSVLLYRLSRVVLES